MSDYSAVMGVQCPGSLSDSSIYNIDGSCFVSSDSERILCGKFVTVKSVENGYREISDRFDVGRSLPYGVALRSNYITSRDDEGYMAYESGDPINVVSRGRVWVLSQDITQPPTFGTPAAHGVDGFASSTGQEIAGWSYTGGWSKWNGNFYIVEVQLNQSSPYIAAGEQTLINGAVLEANLPSPQSPDKVIIITVSVSPSDADNKTGNWSVDNDQCQIVERDESSAILSTKNGGPNDVHVTWEANDGSGVRAMIDYTFIEQ